MEIGNVFPGVVGIGSFRFNKVRGHLMFLIFLRSSVIEGGKGKPLFLIIKQYPWLLCWEVLKTTFRFHDWLKGLTKLRKAVMLTFLVYCSEKDTD